MRLSNVVGYTVGNVSRNVAFGRAPKKGQEEKEYGETIQKALDYLGIQNQALIIHAPSFPANTEWDTKTGSPFEADELVELAKLHGFNAIQLGPNGKLNRGDTSPYTSSIFEKNPLFINFPELTSTEYASILSKKDLDNHSSKTKATGKNYDRVDFKKARKNTEELINVAYNNFMQKLSSDDEQAKKLNAEFEQFQSNNSEWLEYYSVLDIIGERYGTDHYPNWKKEDQDLIQDVKKGDRIAIKRFNDIQNENATQIDKYKFTQFLIDKQMKADNAKRGDFTYIGDLEVGASSFDELVFRDVFLPGYKIGCKTGGPVHNCPQLWGFAVPDPNKLFNADGSLGPSGKYIQAKIKNGLAGAQNIRIDHAMGLVSPYVYKPDSVQYGKEWVNGKLIEYPIRETMHADYISRLGIDHYNSYTRIIPDIVLPTMREMGIDPKKVVWEDLGKEETGLFEKVFKEDAKLPGISGMIWTLSENAKQKRDNWAYIGCHDNMPVRQLIADGEHTRRPGWAPEYLTDSLRCDPYKGYERTQLYNKLTSNPREIAKAKMAELFNTTKNIQVSFMDFFGINKSFNTPGTTNDENWTLRLNPNFKETYYKSLEENGWAMNMPELLQTAVQAKFDEDVSRNGINYEWLKNKINPLLSDLGHWSNVLKEKSN